jgi:capsid protein
MWQFLRDKWHALQLRAKYQRLIQERVLELIEERGPQPVADDPGDWQLWGGGKGGVPDAQRGDLRTQARQLVQTNPYARNLLRLLEIYVVGPGLRVTAVSRDPDRRDVDLERACDVFWMDFLHANQRHFTLRETARRTWRDGECFVRLFAQPAWPPTVRYIDPEAIGGEPRAMDEPGASATGAIDAQGLLTHPDDVESVRGYLRRDVVTGEVVEQIPPDELLHLKIGVDTNEKRGLTIFAPVLDMLAAFDRWLDTELQARKLQSSIVLWRKVQGSPSQVTALADNAQSSSVIDPLGAVRRERYRPGTILTTSHATELEFLHPNTNFADAVPLGRLVLLGIAAGSGVPEFMLTSDASNANFSSTMIAEGPAVKLFESEQQFFARELEPLWRWVLSQAASLGLLPPDVLERVSPQWTFPQLVNRDRAKEREVDARLVEAQVLSRAEVARRDNVDPAVMQAEIAAERAHS